MKSTAYSLQPTTSLHRGASGHLAADVAVRFSPLQVFPRSPVYGLRSASVLFRPTVSGLPAAFTLIELLVVMVIAVVIMAVSLPSFISMGRGAGMRTAVNNVRSTVALSRQWAITHQEEITFVASATGMVYNMTNGLPPSIATNDHACYYVIIAGQPSNLIQSITDLPLDVTFSEKSSDESETNLTFKTDGGLATGSDTKKIVLVDKKKSDIKTTISVNGLTGGIQVE